MESSEAPDAIKSLDSSNYETNGDAVLIFRSSPSSEFGNSQWRKEIFRKSVKGGKGRRYIRSQSLCVFQKDKYSAGEIRRIRERLLRTHSHTSGDFRSFTRTQKLALTALCVVDFTSFCSMSVMAPFFPKEAASKGMSDTLSGFVFGFYALIMFLSSPLFGKILPRVGAKFLLMSGMFVAGGCNIIFGTLAHIESLEIFTLYCFMVRGMEALGASAYATASYVFVVDIFPDNIGSVLGILETFVGLGMSIGPAFGGFLYSIGGFELPFYTLGVLMVLIVPINFCLLPAGDASSLNKSSGSLSQLLRLPSVIIISMVIVVASNTWGFLDPTLEPHLREFHLTPEKVGLIFLLFSALYGIFSPLWGWLADRVNNHWAMLTVGLFICSIGLLLLGPSPLLPFLHNTLWLNLVALSILGVAVALTLLPTFQGVLDSALDGGCSDEIGTYSMVAGVWSCMYSLGEVIGPLLGGALMDKYGFPLCSTVMAGLCFLLSVITLLYFSTQNSRTCAGKESSTTDSGISDTTGSWDQADEAGNGSISSPGQQGSFDAEDSPLLGAMADQANMYTHEKVYHCPPDMSSYDGWAGASPGWLNDVRRTVAITGGGACEV
ncbi:Vesicular acetylcholine transporter [Gryllus bimaculatus]|nr:Vesicular acetylcholine transporter [Gryllus bimaculatus]